MIARLIVQTNSAGEKHVTFTQDRVTPTEELLLTAPGWEDSAVTESQVLILGMGESEETLDTLVDTELHSAWTQHACYMPDRGIMATILGQLNGEVR